MLDEAARKILLEYLSDVRALPNEAAKRTRFASLLSALFPGAERRIKFASGVERVVRIDTGEGKKVGRIDAYFGNAVIEFENSLKATGDEAERQLKEYTSGLWNKEGRDRPLICIASDGLVWRTYRPRLKSGAGRSARPGDVELERLRDLVVTPDGLRDFWLWLTSLLFRPARTIPSAEQFRIDFGATSPAFADALDALSVGWAEVGAQPEIRTAIETWHKYLTYTYGQLGTLARSEGPAASPRRKGGGRATTGLPVLPAELVTLFLKHTYLVSMARMLVWASLSGGRSTESLRDTARDILSGRSFRALKIENLVEDDFFQWVHHKGAEPVLAPVWERILLQMQTYDLARLGQDVLKGIYQELVDPKDRHDLGEYYTPDWLCERIISELLPQRGAVQVLDPTCGSGSFLRAAITHLLAANRSEDEATRLRIVLDHVVGIDIHPVAVTISLATYVLALGPLVQATKRPMQIPVYLADSLFLPSEVSQLRFGEVPGYEIRFGGDRKVSVPDTLVRLPELFDPAITACADIATELARSGRESPETLRAYLGKAIPELKERKDFDSIATALWGFSKELADLIARKRDSIWAFIVRNSYRPAMFRDRFEVIVGNPPWLSYRYIADPEYQAEVKRRALDEYAIVPRSQKLMTQMELATVFLVHTLATFGRRGSRLGFVMPRSILTADQHAPLRQRTYTAPVTIDRYWDLRDVEPVFKVPACVVFATKEAFQPGDSYSLPAVEWEGRLAVRDAPWSEARSSLTTTEKTARVSYLGSRTALTTGSARMAMSQPSPYAARFRQGATLVPRSFYFVKVRGIKGAVDPDGLYWAETDPEQAAQAKPPYQDVRVSGQVEGRFIFGTAISKHVLPFALLEPAVVVLPLEEVEGRLEMRTADQLRAEGCREFAKWMARAEKTWAEKRTGKADKQSVYQRLDYSRELTHQTMRPRHLVLYNAAGSNLSATPADRRDLSLPFIVDHKLYWATCKTRMEADYLAAILNSAVVNETIKPFQSRGLLGERDIHKKVLELRIPSFDSDIPDHHALADIAADACVAAGRFLVTTRLPKSLGRRRSLVREALRGRLEKIDEIVRRILSGSPQESSKKALDSRNL